MRVIWNTSHHEFTVFDYYYFSSLELYLKNKTVLVENKRKLDEVNLNPSDILVINYPEDPFSEAEKLAVKDFVENGGKLVVTAYYQNEDNVAEVCTSLLSFARIRFLDSWVATPEEGFLTTASVSEEAKEVIKNCSFQNVYFPCSCEIEAEDAVPILKVAGKPVAVLKRLGQGTIIGLGTAVFWDNFSIDREDNWNFVNWIFS